MVGHSIVFRAIIFKWKVCDFFDMELEINTNKIQIFVLSSCVLFVLIVVKKSKNNISLVVVHQYFVNVVGK